ncbi:MAG: hypothetical protein RLW62_15825 [Gammaproteobacteria bacterium]
MPAPNPLRARRASHRIATLLRGTRLSRGGRMLVLTLTLAASFTGTAAADDVPCPRPPWVFAWMLGERCALEPRGGTTRGVPVTLARTPAAAWRTLQADEESGEAHDRLAIRALAGEFRASFEFIETLGFAPAFTPARPYQSWGTEVVLVLADEPGFVSLQHLLVMFIEGESAPFVMKHWRQDWRYEAPLRLAYGADGRWRQVRDEAVAGTWTQTVYQVDDAPRYAARGRWEHRASDSTWISAPLGRPLPRREFSVRDDYDRLHGTHRLVVLPTGWVHEQHNRKLRHRDGDPPGGTALAEERGLNRYERIVDQDFSAGHAWWDATAPLWADVRATWARQLAGRESFALAGSVAGRRLFEHLFARAATYAEGAPYDGAEARAWLAELIARYLR